MGLQSKFTLEQDAYINSFHAALEEVFERDKTLVAKWKEETANEIAQHKLFLNKLPSKEEDPANGASPKEWLNVWLNICLCAGA